MILYFYSQLKLKYHESSFMTSEIAVRQNNPNARSTYEPFLELSTARNGLHLQMEFVQLHWR